MQNYSKNKRDAGADLDQLKLPLSLQDRSRVRTEIGHIAEENSKLDFYNPFHATQLIANRERMAELDQLLSNPGESLSASRASGKAA